MAEQVKENGLEVSEVELCVASTQAASLALVLLLLNDVCGSDRASFQSILALRVNLGPRKL